MFLSYGGSWLSWQFHDAICITMPTGWFAGGKWEVGARILLEESYLYSAMWSEDQGLCGVQPGLPD
jgi:hypothetical protein